ncbi:M56 family metallopeptidase, partial [Planctomycetota bacterium]
MNAIFETVNSVGVRFVDFALPMLIQSSVLILILLLADALLRKKVRAVFRYWIWMVVLLKLVLPTSLSSPVSLGRWFGDELASVEITQRIAEPEAKVVPSLPVAAPSPSNPA